MKDLFSRLAVMTLLSSLALFPSGASAMEIDGKLSSVTKFYKDYFGRDDSLPVYLYGTMKAKDITTGGLSFSAYGRIADDIMGDQDEDSELYYAYFEQRDLIKDVDVRIGRQYLFSAAGNAIVDGIYLKYKPFTQLNLSVFGGGDVKLDESYDEDDNVIGGEVFGRTDELSYKLGYLRKYDEEALTKELAGLELEYNYNDLLRVYSDLQYNLLSEHFSYALGGISFYQKSWDVNLEYLYSLPVFESTSIYSVFAVEEYRELYSKFRYKFANGLHAYASYAREFYQEFDDADVFEIGIDKIRTDKFQGYLAGVLRHDDTDGDTRGVKAYASYFFHRYALVGAGINFDVYERNKDDDDDTTYRRYYFDITSYLSENINVAFSFETVNSDLYDTYNISTLRLTTSF